jgi:hypothetical protein
MPKKPFYLADSNEVWLTLTDSSFNAVFLVWEQVVPFSGGGTAHMTLWPYYNNFPRHAFSGWHLLNVPTDSNGKLMYAWSFYDWLKGIQAKHRDKI